MTTDQPCRSAVPVSTALAEANARLLARRARLQRARTDARLARAPQTIAEIPDLVQRVTLLPAHLGWESAAVTAAVQRARAQREARAAAADLSWIPPRQSAPEPAAPAPQPAAPWPDTFALQPDLVLAMLRREVEAAGRLWYLLRLIDTDGRGWVTLQAARACFTGRDHPLRFCGSRQLRNLLRDGDGLFWRRDRERIWLRGAAAAAAGLGLKRCRYRPVTVPVAALTGGIGTVRAHFYASFHSGRGPTAGAGKPISRATIEQITGVDPGSQRRYEELLNLTVETNIAVGEEVREGADPLDTAIAQERAWRHGRALFRLRDTRGKQGPKGRTYYAWQLPNSYAAAHQRETRSRKTRLNRRLADLRRKGAGNDQQETAQRYFDDGRALRRSRNAGEGDLYWQTGRLRGGGVWSVWSDLEVRK